MISVLRKIKDKLFIPEEEYYDDVDMEEEEEEEEEVIVHRFSRNARSERDDRKVFSRKRALRNTHDERQEEESLHQNTADVVSYNLTCVENSMPIIDWCKEGKTVVFKMVPEVSVEEKQRIVDVVTGGVRAIDGMILKITNGVFIASPKKDGVVTCEEKTVQRTEY